VLVRDHVVAAMSVQCTAHGRMTPVSGGASSAA